MKLLYACADSASDPLLWSGTVWHCRRALEAAGAEVETMDNIPFECPPHLRVLHQLHKRLGRKTHLLQIEPAILRRAARRLEARFAQGDCDAIFSPGTGVPVYAFLPASIPVFSYLDATKLGWIRTYFGLDSLCARSRRAVTEVDRTSLANSATTFFSSQWAMDEAARDYGVPEERMSVVPFGANLVDPPTRAEVEAWIDARPRGAIRLFFLGKEWERKGGLEAIALVRELRLRGIQATLDVVGCTPELSADDRALVELHGFIDHSTPDGRRKFRELLSRAYVLVFMSRAEAFGIALCEAAAFGVPVYASDIGGIPTVIRPGSNGWLSNSPFSAVKAATKLETALANPAEYRRLALGARDDFENRLNWSAAGGNIVRRIEQTLALRRAAPRERTPARADPGPPAAGIGGCIGFSFAEIGESPLSSERIAMIAPVLCTACNETYALGGTVALCSALRRIAPTPDPVRVYVLDGGMREKSWEKLTRSLELTGRAHRLIRLKPEMGRFTGLPQDWGSSVMTYARLALPELVEETRLVYVDADMVIQADVTPLANQDFGHAIIAAAPDVITLTLGQDTLPLTELNLPASDPYFQAGFLVIDLPRWRAEKVSERVLTYLRTWPKHAKFWDQSALNVVLHRRWHQLPTSWNTPAWWAESGRGGCRVDGEVLHFVGPHKPWLLGHDQGAGADRFFDEVRRTAWGRWRPNRVRFALKMLRYRLGQLVRPAK